MGYDTDTEIIETAPGEVLELHRLIDADRLAAEVGDALTDLLDRASEAGLQVSGPPSVTYQGRTASGSLEIDLSVAIAPGVGRDEVGPDARVTARRPRQVARTIHQGGYSTIGTAYEELGKWVERHGYRPVGPLSETYLVGPDTADPTGYRTEVLLPVAPALGPTVHLDTDVPTALIHTKEALRDNGFGVLSEIDVRATLRERIGAELEDYVILGVCAPTLAKRALDIDREAGLLLPCTVVVRTRNAGSAVTFLDPALMVRATGIADLAIVADQARQALDGAMAALRAVAD